MNDACPRCVSRRAAPAGGRVAKYPGFCDQPMAAFIHPAHDLVKYAEDFPSGDGGEFTAAAKFAEERKKCPDYRGFRVRGLLHGATRRRAEYGLDAIGLQVNLYSTRNVEDQYGNE